MSKPEVITFGETGYLHSFRASQHNALLTTNGKQLDRHQTKEVTELNITRKRQILIRRPPG